MGSKRKRGAKELANDPLLAHQQPTQKRSKKDAATTTNGTSSKPSKSSSTALPSSLDKSPFTLQPSVEERRRELGLYELLGSEDVADRINAADAIVSGLLGGSDGGVPEPVLLRHLDKRLFRGLASGRNASRLGFSLVLTEILGQLFGGQRDLVGGKYTGLTFERVLGILIEKTTSATAGSGGGSGQQERDHYFGQLFGIECFVRAGILFDGEDEGEEGGDKRWEAVLEVLLKLSHKKSWLRAQCGWIVAQAVAYMKKRTAERTLKTLVEEGIAKTPEGVGIWIAALDKFGDELKTPEKPWRNPLASNSLQGLPAVLKDSGRDTSSSPGEQEGGGGGGKNKKQVKQSNWTAQLHFVWDLILGHFAKMGAKKGGEEAAAEGFKLFWVKVVDEGFFSKNSSDSQKFSGFMIFQKMLEGLTACPFILDSLFSKNLMGCLMNQAAKEDRFLHRAALKALKAIEATVEKNPDFLPAILKQLLGHHGVYNFDQRTNTKTVDRILQFSTPATIKPVVKTLKLKDPSKATGLDDDAVKYYQALGGYLFRLANVPSSEFDSDDDTCSSSSKKSVPGTAIKLLTELAYSNAAVPASIREALRTRTTSAFARLVKRPEDFFHLCGAILSIETDVDPEDEVAALILPQAYERLRDLLDPATAKKGTSSAARQALALLYAIGILQFYNEDPDVVDLFDELDECYTKLSGSERGEKDEGEEEEEGVAEYLVEILLAMVARPSSLMRQVSQQVFEAFTGLMTREALRLLTDPLAADESEKGQQALFSTEDEDMMDAEAATEGSDHDGDEEEEGLDSDVEIVDLEDVSGSEIPDDSDDDEESADEKGGDKDNQEELEALDKALAEVLGSHRLDEDAEAASDDGSDMTDSEMMAVDAKLAEIFKHRAATKSSSSKKKEKRDAKDTVVNFKHRVLDLLAIFAKNEAPLLNPLAFDMVLPLLHLVRTTTTKALSRKACEIVLAFAAGLKKARHRAGGGGGVNAKKVDGDELMALLEEIHGEACKDPSHAFAKAVSTASLAVASVLCGKVEGGGAGESEGEGEGVESSKEEEVFELYARTQLRWFRGEVKIQAAFFSEWLNWCQSHASTAAAKREEDEEK